MASWVFGQGPLQGERMTEDWTRSGERTVAYSIPTVVQRKRRPAGNLCESFPGGSEKHNRGVKMRTCEGSHARARTGPESGLSDCYF